MAAFTVNAEKALVFDETFANCKSTTVQGGYFAESLYFDSPTMGDNDGWFTENCYMSERAIKFSAKTKHGKATSPAINLVGDKGDLTVYFRAQNWRGDNLVINVEIAGMADSKQTLDLTDSYQISDRSTAGSCVTFTDVPTGSKLVFSGTGKEGGSGVTRFFLSDIQVFQEVPGGQGTSHLRVSTAYHHFDDIMAGNDSEERYVNAYGYGASASDPELILPEGSDFRLKEVVNADCEDGGRHSGFTLVFDPRSAGYKEEVAQIKMGDVTRNLILSGSVKVYRPEMGEATDVTADGAKLTWPAVKGMDKLDVVVWTLEKGALVAPDLMFSKYIEGKSNNRAVEIFNGTGKDVALKGYYLMMESNGAGGLTANKFELPDVTLANGKSYSICNANYEAVREIADKTIGYQDGGYANIMTFTGDDAIALFNGNDELVDLLGYESTDVNDRVSGDWGMDVTYYRKPGSYTPTKKFYEDEWIKYPMDYCENFGSHLMDAEGDVRKVVRSIEIEDTDMTELRIDGLEANTTYHFAVRGHSNGLETHFSPEAVFTTTKSNGVESVEAGEDVTPVYYDINGLRVDPATAAHGVYVKITGAKAEKVIL